MLPLSERAVGAIANSYVYYRVEPTTLRSGNASGKRKGPLQAAGLRSRRFVQDAQFTPSLPASTAGSAPRASRSASRASSVPAVYTGSSWSKRSALKK